jgi:3-isopropylmalate/(R)-2-methylmalate dehydratase small subunit
MERFPRLETTTVVLLRDDVDTDQIIPARFLTGTSREGLGRGLFAGWRFDAEGGARPEFPLNRPEAHGATVLVAGRNFGCGSSREHAVWALAEFGFRAVVAISFGDIFRGNALKNGLLAVAVDAAVRARLAEASGSAVTVDLADRTLTLADGTRVGFEVDAFARHCLLEGIDEMEFLLGQEAAIAAYEARSAR